MLSFSQVPDSGSCGFPSNHYVTELLRRETELLRQESKDGKDTKEPECPVHHIPVNMFCDDAECQLLLCAICIMTTDREHINHTVIPVSEPKGNALLLKRLRI